MAPCSLSTLTRKRLYSFARPLARPFSDSQRRRFIHDILTGLVIANHVHLSKIARTAGRGSDNSPSAEKRLRKHLGSEHWDASPLADQLLRQSAARVGEDTLLVADLTDPAKYTVPRPAEPRPKIQMPSG